MFHFKTRINSQLIKIWGLVILAIAIPVTFNSCKAFIAATEDGLAIQSSELSTLKDLQGQAVSGSEIRLSWSVTTAGQMAYSIFRNDQYIATTTDTLFADTGLTSNTSYTYKVYAADIDTGANAASGIIVVSTLEDGQAPEPIPVPVEPTPEPEEPTPTPTEPPPVCTAGTTTKINCTSQIPYASSASITKTCKADGSGYTQTTCQLESCLSSHEISGNTCVEKQAPPSGVSVSFSEDGGKTYSLLSSSSVLSSANVVLKFDNLSDVKELRVYCCKGFDSQNNPVGEHSIVQSKSVLPSQPTMSLDLSSITQDYKRELYFDALKTDNSIKGHSNFFNLSQALLAENQAPSGGGETPTPSPSPTPTPPSGEGILFHDSFESGDMSETNSSGFSWFKTNKTSIVNSSGYVVYNGSHVNLGPYPDREWEGFTGSHSLRFRYPAGEAWTEQRFSMGESQPDLWISYWIRVPINYKHGSGGGGATNNKFISIWMDGYSQKGDGSSFWLSMENAGNGNTNLAFTYSLGSYTTSLAMQQYKPFINASTDKGRWMKIVIHLKTPSSSGANDGVIETYRKWESESSFTKLHGKYDVPFKVPSGLNGFQKGYLLGWANGSYSEDTEWLIDDFKLSTTSLLNE